MTRNNLTRRIVRTASQIISTLALAASLFACSDSISGPVSTPPSSSGTGSTGTGSTGTGSTGTAIGTNVITISRSGYKDLNLVGDKGFSQVSRDTTTIYFEGVATDGTPFGFLITALGSKSGRYGWNDPSHKDALFIIGNSMYNGTNGETVITSIDLAKGRMKGTFSGTIASKTNSSSTYSIKGSFDLQIVQ